MLGTLRAALRSDDPTALTTLISSMLSVTDAWASPADDPDSERIPLDALVESFVETPYAESTAALHVIAALLPGRARCRARATRARRP